jgi:hypothetical protein
VILNQISDYLQRRGEATVADIALHVDADASAVRIMLDRLAAKGKVTRLEMTPGCGSKCQKCQPEATEIYRWGGGKDNETGQALPWPQHCRSD